MLNLVVNVAVGLPRESHHHHVHKLLMVQWHSERRNELVTPLKQQHQRAQINSLALFLRLLQEVVAKLRKLKKKRKKKKIKIRKKKGEESMQSKVCTDCPKILSIKSSWRGLASSMNTELMMGSCSLHTTKSPSQNFSGFGSFTLEGSRTKEPEELEGEGGSQFVSASWAICCTKERFRKSGCFAMNLCAANFCSPSSTRMR